MTYPRQRIVRARNGPEADRHVLLAGIPLGQAPFLHPLCDRWPGLVRRPLTYYEPVRLPMSVQHRRASLDFPTRPTAFTAADRHGISGFSREVWSCMRGVFDRMGFQGVLRWRHQRCGLPLFTTASAPRRKLSRLSDQPARTPVNASHRQSPASAHDSGPVCAANPSPYDSFIHDTSPVQPGARENES